MHSLCGGSSVRLESLSYIQLVAGSNPARRTTCAYNETAIIPSFQVGINGSNPFKRTACVCVILVKCKRRSS
jgi:hypothetical protein